MSIQLNYTLLNLIIYIMNDVLEAGQRLREDRLRRALGRRSRVSIVLQEFVAEKCKG